MPGRGRLPPDNEELNGPRRAGEEVKRVLVITSNLNQASFRLRVAALIEPLARLGFFLEVRVRPSSLAAQRQLAGSAGEFHAVLLQRKLLDPSEARLLRSRARRIFYDVDDAVMYHPGRASFLSRWRARRRFIATARIADRVVAGNDYLAGLFRRRGCRVNVLPTAVALDRYRLKEHNAAKEPRLVWIGSHSTVRYLREFLPFIERAAQRVADRGVRLNLLTISDETVTSQVLNVEHIPWSADVEASALVRGDIGIAPLPEDRWTLGKCGFKLLQYMAAGLPVVASPVGIQAQIVRAEVTGLLPERGDDWPAAIVALAGEPSLRAQMGAEGRLRAEREYPLQRAVDEWARILGD